MLDFIRNIFFSEREIECFHLCSDPFVIFLVYRNALVACSMDTVSFSCSYFFLKLRGAVANVTPNPKNIVVDINNAAIYHGIIFKQLYILRVKGNIE